MYFCTLCDKSIHGSNCGSNGNGTADGYMLEPHWICVSKIVSIAYAKRMGRIDYIFGFMEPKMAPLPI